MYCVKCGVRLADTEEKCPLCLTRVYHPGIQGPQGAPLFPKNICPAPQRHPKTLAVSLTVLWVLAALVVLLCNWQLNRAVTWSGYVLGALLTCYTALILPRWFCRPNPVIFVPCSFAALALYLLYISLVTGGRWFLPFALPVTGSIGLILTVLVTLLRYVRRGQLFTVGSCLLALGFLMPVTEFLLHSAFAIPWGGWSVYPLTALVLLGGFLLFLGICRPARETMKRKFFF